MRASRLLAALLLVAVSAHASPPPGTDLSSPEHAWWECHHDPADGKVCCNVADGHVLKDDDWKIGPDGHYKIRVETSWFDVPQSKVSRFTASCRDRCTKRWKNRGSVPCAVNLFPLYAMIPNGYDIH